MRPSTNLPPTVSIRLKSGRTTLLLLGRLLGALSTLMVIGLAVSTASNCLADDYPSHPIRLVVPFPAGGGVDTIARIMQPKLEAAIGQPVVIDNRPGAASIIGTNAVATAGPDGYTLLFALNPHVVNASLYKSLPYDPITSFAPVTLVATVPNILVVNPELPVTNVAELINAAREHPGKLNFASAGIGSPFHLAGELFRAMTKTDITHVPYKGGPQATVDLLSGRVQIMFGNSFNVLPYVKSGKLRPLAVTSTRRLPQFPDLPTIGETVPGYSFVSWFGILAPAGTPQNITQRVYAAVVKSLGDEEVKRKLAEQDATPVGDTPEEFGKFLREEITKWSQVIKQSGIKPE